MKIGLESSEKVGDLMIVVLSYHHSGGSSEVCLLILQDPGCLGEEGAFEEGSSCTWCLPTPWMFAREEDGQGAGTILHH